MDATNKCVNLSLCKSALPKPYNPPRLIQWGTIAEVTRGETGGGFDEGTGQSSAWPQAPGRPKSAPLK